MNTRRKCVRIIGGGFTGTLAAYFLVKKGFQVTLVDDTPTEIQSAGNTPQQLGGMIRTLPLGSTDHETAANGFLAHGLLESVAEDIGVRLVPASDEARKNRFLWTPRHPRAAKWPLSFLETFVTAFRFLKARLLGRAAPRAGESVEAWGHRVIGRPATDQLLATALLGIYAAPISGLSARLILGRFFSRGSAPSSARFPKPTLRGTVAPEKGMGEWFSALRRFLEKSGVQVIHERVKPLEPTDPPTWVCTSAPAAAELLARVAPELSASLRRIEMLPVAKLSIQSADSPENPAGFGCLFHPDSGFSSLGVLFSSSIFPARAPSGVRCETWILGGKVAPEVPQLSDEELKSRALADRQRLIPSPLDRTSLQHQLVRWPRAFPHYSLELEALLETLPPPPDGVTLSGNYLGSLGLSQIAQRVYRQTEEFSA